MKDKINYHIFLPAMFLLFFLESTFIAQFWTNFPPNLVLILLFASIFLSRSSDFVYVAFFFGFLSDIFSGSHFGISTLSFVLTAMAVFMLKVKFMKEDRFTKIVGLSACAAILYDLSYLFLAILVYNADFNDYAVVAPQKILFDTIYAAALVYPAMHLIYKEQE